MANITTANDPWSEDLLGYKTTGQTYTTLVQSIDTAKVISIEAGFGRGKTFFRTAWAQHLREQGEIVVEIDALHSDHSGEPVITFLGALIASLPPSETSKLETAYASAKKVGGLTLRTLAHAILRNGAEEVFTTVTEAASDQVEGIETLHDTIDEFGDGLSTLAGNLITAQLAAEQVRTKELPDQLNALHAALTQNTDQKRIIILIDELDRCHPEYAIALLEAMKLVFNHDGFVFCLMVNAEYLESLANRRFGSSVTGENYLDKFVDLRLNLPMTDQALGAAAKALAADLPLEIPYGDSAAFSVEAAAELAGQIAPISGLSMRQIKRVLTKVELALRCYRNQPLDCPLLVFLAFEEAMTPTNSSDREVISRDLLPRARLTPEIAQQFTARVEYDQEGRQRYEAEKLVHENFKELAGLAKELYKFPDEKNYFEWAAICMFLAKHYIPDHTAILNAIHAIDAG